MTDNRRIKTNNHYGGVLNRLLSLRSMLEHIRNTSPSRSEVIDWVISNTQATSQDAVSRHMEFLEYIEIIELTNERCKLGDYGKLWLNENEPEVIYNAITSGVKGFDKILQELTTGSMTDEEIKDLLVSEFEEAQKQSNQAKRHREWLRALGYIKRRFGINRITPEGFELIKQREREHMNFNQWYIRPDVGERFTVRVDRISSSGNAIINWKYGHLNIGPISQNCVGEEVEVEKMKGKYGFCISSRWKDDAYITRFREVIDEGEQLNAFEDVGAASSEKDVLALDDDASNNMIQFCSECGAMMKLHNERWKCTSCGSIST